MTEFEFELLQELRKIRKALECLINGVLICPDSDPEKERMKERKGVIPGKIPRRRNPKLGRGHHRSR